MSLRRFAQVRVLYMCAKYWSLALSINLCKRKNDQDLFFDGKIVVPLGLSFLNVLCRRLILKSSAICNSCLNYHLTNASLLFRATYLLVFVCKTSQSGPPEISSCFDSLASTLHQQVGLLRHSQAVSSQITILIRTHSSVNAAKKQALKSTPLHPLIKTPTITIQLFKILRHLTSCP